MFILRLAKDTFNSVITLCEYQIQIQAIIHCHYCLTALVTIDFNCMEKRCLDTAAIQLLYHKD